MSRERENADTGNSSAKAVLLVVDDETAVCRAIARVMRRHFAEVLCAANAQEAEAILATHPVTHLICDHWFGKGQPLGLDLVGAWARAHAGLTRVLLLTGVDIRTLSSPSSVVRIIPKTADAAELLRELGVQ